MNLDLQFTFASTRIVEWANLAPTIADSFQMSTRPSHVRRDKR